MKAEKITPLHPEPQVVITMSLEEARELWKYINEHNERPGMYSEDIDWKIFDALKGILF